MMTLFIKYDQDFEYSADLPEIFVRLVSTISNSECLEPSFNGRFGFSLIQPPTNTNILFAIHGDSKVH